MINPDDGRISLAEYAETWIDERPGLRPKTVELYRYLARKHLAQVLGPMPIADIQPGHVRRWRKHLLDAEVSAVTLAKAYRLLKTIMTTAALRKRLLTCNYVWVRPSHLAVTCGDARCCGWRPRAKRVASTEL